MRSMNVRHIQNLLAAVLFGQALAGCADDGAMSDPFDNTHSTHDVMTWVLDPAADHVWASAGQIITETETVDLAPRTDEGWDRVRHSAAVVAEVGNLMLVPAHARDNEDWAEISRGLSRAGHLAEQAAAAHDADALFEAGGVIYNVCVSCHQLYAAHLRL
jgi:hypothetical protein